MELIKLEKTASGWAVYYHNGVMVGDIQMDVDGYYYYWPIMKPGFWASHFMRAVADKLDELNAPYDKELEEYFSKQESAKEHSTNSNDSRSVE